MNLSNEAYEAGLQENAEARPAGDCVMEVRHVPVIEKLAEVYRSLGCSME